MAEGEIGGEAVRFSIGFKGLLMDRGMEIDAGCTAAVI